MTLHSFLRMSASELPRLRLQHLASGVDGPEDGLPASGGGGGEATPAAFTGFTEWVGADDPGVSLGWDWEAGPSGLMAFVPGTLRTNLVLTDATGADLPREATLRHLAEHLAQWPWQAAVLEHLKAAAP